MAKGLSYTYRGIPGRTGAALPVAIVVDSVAGTYHDGSGWTPDAAKAKRHALGPMAGDPGRYALALPGDWPPTTYVAVFDLATDPAPIESGPAAIAGDPPAARATPRYKLTAIMEPETDAPATASD